MEKQDAVTNLFELIGKDAFSWERRARHLRIAAEAMLERLNETISSDEVTQEIIDKQVAYLNSFMLLTGYAFENLIRGIIVAQNPDLINDEKLSNKEWNVRAGHGISVLAQRITTLNQTEIDVLDRLEEFSFWAGRYPIPKLAKTYKDATVPRNLLMTLSTDQGTINGLFDRFSQVLADESRKHNSTQ